MLALWLQGTRGWGAGHVLLAADAVIFVATFSFLVPGKLALSFLSAAALSLVMILDHWPGRYRAA